MASKDHLGNSKRTYDLFERTSVFGEEVIAFAEKIPRTVITFPLIRQWVKAGTSIGANYCEADCAESRKDFEHKIGICIKEAKECTHWLRMIVKAVPKLSAMVEPLSREVVELRLIFLTIVKNSRANRNEKIPKS